MSVSTQKLAIVGKGSIGGLLAFRCELLRYEYQLLLRSKTRFRLNVEDIRGNRHNLSPETSDIGKASEFDILIVPTKAYQVLPALKQLGTQIQDSHIIVLLHNGMGTVEQVRHLYPNNPLIAATTSYGAFKPCDSSLKETGIGETHLGWLNFPNTEYKEEVESTLSKLLPPSTWHQDINLALWKKLAINAVINPLTAIHNIKNGHLVEQQYRDTITAQCQEIASVMNASGYLITADDVYKNVMTVIHATAKNYSSMHQDIMHQRQSEIEFINGYVAKKAQEHGIHAPINEALYRQVTSLQQHQTLI